MPRSKGVFDENQKEQSAKTDDVVYWALWKRPATESQLFNDPKVKEVMKKSTLRKSLERQVVSGRVTRFESTVIIRREICSCGHSKADHNATDMPFEQRLCEATDCGCKGYVFSKKSDFTYPHIPPWYDISQYPITLYFKAIGTKISFTNKKRMPYRKPDGIIFDSTFKHKNDFSKSSALRYFKRLLGTKVLLDAKGNEIPFKNLPNTPCYAATALVVKVPSNLVVQRQIPVNLVNNSSHGDCGNAN